MSNPYLSSLSMYQYGPTSTTSGTVTIKHDASQHQFDLDEQAVHEIKMAVDGLVRRRREIVAQELRVMEVLPAISYHDRATAVDAEPIHIEQPALEDDGNLDSGQTEHVNLRDEDEF